MFFPIVLLDPIGIPWHLLQLGFLVRLHKKIIHACIVVKPNVLNLIFLFLNTNLMLSFFVDVSMYDGVFSSILLAMWLLFCQDIPIPRMYVSHFLLFLEGEIYPVLLLSLGRCLQYLRFFNSLQTRFSSKRNFGRAI